MAQNSFFVVISVVFVVLIGSLPCQAEQVCDIQDISDCYNEAHYGSGPCPYYKPLVECLEVLKANCSNDDTVMEQITQALAIDRAHAEECKGLPAGSCFASAVMACNKDVPHQIRIVHSSPEATKKACDAFKGKEETAKKCLKTLKTNCVSSHSHDWVDMAVGAIEKIEKTCGKVKKS